MAFSLPAIKVKPELPSNATHHDTPYGVPDLMTYGFTSAKSTAGVSHPLMHSEANYVKNRNELNMNILRNTQGMHAPLKIAMEIKAAKKIGRLPFMPSSNIMLDVLTGKDIEMGFEDYLNPPEFCEVAGQPHAVCEKSLGIL